MNIRIVKTDSWHNTVTFVVLEPNVEDRNWDIISEDEVIKTAHEFMINLNEKKINVDHEKDSDLEKEDAMFVESFITPIDIPTSWEDVIRQWSRLVAIRFSDDIYQKILDWDIVWISMEWRWIV